MIKLYWSPRSRSFSAIWLLEETGLPYERVLTDITTGAQKAPEYLAINPMGKVPGLKDGDSALGEAAAICAYIADRYPETKLAPAATDPLRARYLQWLFFSPSCIEPALIQLFTKLEVPASTAAWGSAAQTFDVLDAALQKGPWILGEKFSAACRDALDLLGNYDRDTLLSQNAFYRDVYKPNRDSLVEKWSVLVEGQVKKEKTTGRPSRP